MQEASVQLSPDGRYRWTGTEWVPNIHGGGASAKSHGPASWFEAEPSEDLFSGQRVIVWARWILIATGLLLSFWIPAGTKPDLLTLQVELAAIVALAFGNFYLHVQLLRGRPANDAIVYAASLGDLMVITALVIVQGGFSSPVFIFYCAAVLGFSVAFPTEVTAIYTVCMLATYGLICAMTSPASGGSTLLVRLVMVAAVAVCGNLFARHEAARRAEAVARHATTDQEA